MAPTARKAGRTTAKATARKGGPKAGKAAGRKAPARKVAKAPARKAPGKAAKAGSRTRPGRTAEEWEHTPAPGLDGWITHTELASRDPDATKAWCVQALGWSFMPSFPTPDGPYHLFAYSDKGGGGIRRNSPPEVPGSIPYVHVADVGRAFAKALAAGATEMVPPTKVMEGVVVAIVKAPGDVPIGFSGGK